MKSYINSESNVCAYDYWNDRITVQFKDWSIYTYTYQSAWSYHIESMKQLANQNDWLNSYIMKNVRKLYASKS